MNKIIKTVLVAAGLIAVVALIWQRAAEPPMAAKAGPAGKGAPSATLVQVEVVGRQAMNQDLRVTGTLMPDEQTELRTEVAGRVAQLNFQEGQAVQAGQVLLTIVADDIMANMRKVEYSLSLARTFAQRQEQLLKKEAISQQEYDQASTSVQVYEADLAALKAQLAKTVVKAPYAGTVGLRYISPGAFLSAGTLITQLVSTSMLKIDFAVPARHATQVKLGQPVKFSVEGSDVEHTASIYAIEPSVDVNTRTLKLRAKFQNHAAYKPGAFVNVWVPLSKSGNSLTVPTEAIVPNGDQATVFVVRSGKAEVVPVLSGVRKATRLEIKNGLQEGDSVITVGVQLVKPGGAVKAVSASAK